MKVSALALGILAAVVLGELALRLVPPPHPSRTAHPACASLAEVQTIFELSKPRARGCVAGQLYETDAFGARGGKGRPRESFRYRIAIAGDSVTMGYGVSAGEAYPQLLENRLRRAGVRRVDVQNFGVAGADIDYTVARVSGPILRAEPDIVVYGLTANDLEGDGYVFFDGRNPWWIAVEPWSKAIALIMRRIGSIREILAPAPDSYVRELEFNFFENPETGRRLNEGLEGLAAAVRDADACPVLFVHPILVHLNERHPFEPIYDRVAAAGDRAGFTVIRGLPTFLGEDGPALWLSASDSHPNPRGHELLATGLLEGLRAADPPCRPPGLGAAVGDP